MPRLDNPETSRGAADRPAKLGAGLGLALALGVALLAYSGTLPGWAVALAPVATLAIGFVLGRRAPAPPAAVREAAMAAPTASAFPSMPVLTAERPDAPLVTGDIDEAARDRVVDDLTAFGAFYDILSQQLCAAIATTEEAANAISGSVSTADSRINDLLAFLQRADSSDKVGKAVREIETQIDACKRLIARFADAQREDAHAGAAQRGRLVAETSAVLKSLEGVDQIALQTTILSMNVSIEAARAGAAGKAFMVIAREIRELASNAKTIASDAGGRIEILLRSVSVDLESETSRREAQEREAFDEISRVLVAFSSNVNAVVRHEREALEEIEKASQAIGGSVVDAMARLQFQDIVRQQLERVEASTAMVNDHLRELGVALCERRPLSLQPSLAEKLDEQFSSYVMDSQRDAHRLAVGQSPSASSAPLIEMF